MLSDAQLVAFVPTRDLEASRAFYEERLGLPLVESSGFANAFDANGTPLRVTLVEELPAVRRTVLGWSVADVRARVAALQARGVTFKRYPGLEQDEAGIWTAPGGSRVAWFADPDGNTLSLQEPPDSRR